MLRRFSLLLVGVLASVGVTPRGLEAAAALPMSKHWPAPSARHQMAGIAAAVGVALALIWVFMTDFTYIPAQWRWF